jgi:hypothetical protein
MTRSGNAEIYLRRLCWLHLCFANTRFSDLWISKHKALSKSVKESVAEDQSVGAGSGTEGPGIPDEAATRS